MVDGFYVPFTQKIRSLAQKMAILVFKAFKKGKKRMSNRTKIKNELTHLHVGQKRPFTQKIRYLAQKWAILVF